MKIKACLVSGHPGDLPLMAGLAPLLAETGRVEPHLLVMRDDTPDPRGVPFTRVPERQVEGAHHSLDLEQVAGYERYAGRYVPGPHFAGREQQAAAGYLLQLARMLPRLEADCFVVWNGAALASRAVVAVAREQGRPVVWLESGYFSRLPVPAELGERTLQAEVPLRTLIWDPVGPPAQGHCLIDEEWEGYPEQPGTLAYMEALRQERSSKYDFADEPVLIGPTPPPGARVLLVAGQVIYDSSMYFCASPVKDPRDLLEQVAFRLPQDWFLLFKPHPLDVHWEKHEEQVRDSVLRRFDNVAFLPRRASLHRALERCDAFLAINSTALLEAAIYNRPAISLGTGFSRGRGFTADLAGLGELHAQLTACPKGLTAEQTARLRRFISYLAYEYVIPIGSPSRAVARLEQAMARSRQGQPGGKGDG